MSTLAIDTIQGATTATSVDMSSVTGLQMPAGHVIQAVGLPNTGRGPHVTSTSTSFTHITKLDVSITPKFATSKIYYNASLSVASGGSNNYGYWDLRRLNGGTETSFGDDSNYGVAKISYAGSWMQIPITFLDSPSTTNALTYRVYHRNHTSGTVYTGWTSSNESKANGLYVTILEIAG